MQVQHLGIFGPRAINSIAFHPLFGDWRIGKEKKQTTHSQLVSVNTGLKTNSMRRITHLRECALIFKLYIAKNPNQCL